MIGEALDPVAERFYQSAWLSALTGICANPKNAALSAEKLATRAEKVAHKAVGLFRKIHLDPDPKALQGQPYPLDHATPAKVQKASKKNRA